MKQNGTMVRSPVVTPEDLGLHPVLLRVFLKSLDMTVILITLYRGARWRICDDDSWERIEENLKLSDLWVRVHHPLKGSNNPSIGELRWLPLWRQLLAEQRLLGVYFETIRQSPGGPDLIAKHRGGSGS